MKTYLHLRDTCINWLFCLIRFWQCLHIRIETKRLFLHVYFELEQYLLKYMTLCQILWYAKRAVYMRQNSILIFSINAFQSKNLLKSWAGVHCVYLFDSSSSKPETPVMDFRYRSRFGMRVIGRCGVYFVKSTPLRAFTGPFQCFEDVLQTYWRCAWRSLLQKKYFLTNLQGFQLGHLQTTASSK